MKKPRVYLLMTLLATLTLLIFSCTGGSPSIQQGASSSSESAVSITNVNFEDQQIVLDIPLTEEEWDAGLQLSPLQIVNAYETLLSSIYTSSVPSVVQITTTTFGGGGSGSGWVWDERGYIITNRHVVTGAQNITVLFQSGLQLPAEIIGEDEDGDIAVIKVDADNLVPLPRGNSNTVIPGQSAIAIGNPFGQDFTMTVGVISAVLRSIPSGVSSFSIPAVIQTDAALNPGNSGGPLLDSSGRVIGMNTQITSGTGANAGVGFAVPINLVLRVVPSLIDRGSYDYSYLGISGRSVDIIVREEANLEQDVSGALIISVEPGQAADRAGLRGDSSPDCTTNFNSCNFNGDIITAINGAPLRSIDDLIALLSLETSPNDTVEVNILRNGQLDSVLVTLGTRPR